MDDFRYDHIDHNCKTVGQETKNGLEISIRLSIGIESFRMTMSNKHNGDSSSSEDEISKDALKEAIDPQFLKNDYFSNEKFQNSDVSKKTEEDNDLTENTNVRNLVSLRKNVEEKTFSNFGVSPTFLSEFCCKKIGRNNRELWILNKTKAWTSRRKGPEFNYKKLKNGTLVEKTQVIG
ncbi:hypothetical protein WN51_05674 [Melipona quadrifasciata]|uniref:Uncharacterized protein n=1 Tax=Melipona quadrifasciata TaxID=166423 RepID=A0A0N0BKR6_9HYME|nr:hypothetical protein WN51_05674 [Melipona quadrifasciata]